MGLSESPSPVVQGPTSSEIVEKSWKKRLSFKDARRSSTSIFMNIATAFFLHLEMTYSIVSGCLDVKSSVLWYIEFVVFLVLILNIVYDIFNYITYYVFSRQLEVTQVQKQLLGVRDSDPGFVLSPVKPIASPASDHSLVFSNSPSSQTAYTPSSSPWSSLGHVTPTNIGSFTGGHSYASPGASFLSTSSGHHTSFDMSTSFTHGNMSGYSSGTSLSHSLPYSPGMSMSSLDGSCLRSRLSMSSSFRSPSPSDKMTDLQSLSMYIKEQEEKQYRANLSSQDMSSNSPSFWNYGRPSIDFSHILRKNQYQLASRSPQSHKSRSDDNDNMGEEVWGPLGVTDDDLFSWIERLRKWIGNTILVKLAQEIDNVNSKLRKIGSEDTEIGEVGVSVLKQLALTKSTFIPTLNALVPYLECSDNQEYLVKRIKELGSDGCFSEYYWCSGGSAGHYGNTWGEHLPTDAGLVMHMLCCYLDARLPPDLKYPDGKTFTSQHFMKTPDKIDLKKNNLLLYQSSINPPYFQVVIKDTIYNLPKGRNNLFHAILYFLYHIKNTENGMLGRVNLGMSGVNILCVIDN